MKVYLFEKVVTQEYKNGKKDISGQEDDFVLITCNIYWKAHESKDDSLTWNKRK